MKRSHESVKAKVSRHSTHLINRLLGWRWRGSTTNRDAQAPQESSSGAQDLLIETQPEAQDVTAIENFTAVELKVAQDSSITNVLFSSVHPTQDDAPIACYPSTTIQPSTTQGSLIANPPSDLNFTSTYDPSTSREPSYKNNPYFNDATSTGFLSKLFTSSTGPGSSSTDELHPSKYGTDINDPLTINNKGQCPPGMDSGYVTSDLPASNDAPQVLELPTIKDSGTIKKLPLTNDLSSNHDQTINFTALLSELPASRSAAFKCGQVTSHFWSAHREERTHHDPTCKSEPTYENQSLPNNDTSINTTVDSSTFGEETVISEQEMVTSFPSGTSSSVQNHFTANFDQRYGGQYLAPEQLPEFCEQLHQLVQMIRNIQAYSTVTGEYPTALERRLAAEAREVAALAAEVRNARESVERARAQRRAVRAMRRDTARHLSALREEEMRELEGAVRSADRKLYKSWECLREATDVRAFDPLLSEVKGKQNALTCLTRLIENRCAALELLSSSASPAPRSLPPLLPSAANSDQSPRTRYYPSKRPFKRKKRERDVPSHSVPVSNDPSQHSTDQSSSRVRPASICTITNQRGVNLNPMSVPYELISQSGIPANMLPSMGSNSNHNLTLNAPALPSFVPFRFSARQFGPASEIRVTSSDRDTVGDMVFMRIDDRSTDV